MAIGDLNREIDAISNEMRGVSLHRDDVHALRGELFKLREPHLAAQEQKAKELEQAEKEKLRVKRERLTTLKETIVRLVKEGEKLELEALAAAFADIEAELEQIEISKMEKQQIERSFRPLKDLIADKKERSMLNLSDDDKKTLENLRIVLQQKKQRRQEIKDQLETYRKALGGSSLDFEKAMHYQELVEQEKERLDKANAGIAEIEQKISEVEG
jgi:DNA repair exonuclease SbcCD ATPase subunit